MCVSAVVLLYLFAGTSEVKDISEATVFTLNHLIVDEQQIKKANSVKSDLLIRAWFKWNKALDYESAKWVIPQAKKDEALYLFPCPPADIAFALTILVTTG